MFRSGRGKTPGLRTAVTKVVLDRHFTRRGSIKVLDFGAGLKAYQTSILRDNGFHRAQALDIGENFDPAEFRTHLQETMDVGKDYFIEFVFRDTNLLTGAMVERLAQACDIVRDLSGHPEGSHN